MPRIFFPRRYWVLHSIVGILFLVVFYQLLQLSVLRRGSLLELADRQHLLRIEIPPFRGQILDRKGRELATNLKVPSIYAVPRLLGSRAREALAPRLAEILNLNQDFIRERLSRDKSFVWLKRRVPLAVSAEVRGLSSTSR